MMVIMKKEQRNQYRMKLFEILKTAGLKHEEVENYPTHHVLYTF
jgi:hypothetical protein